MHEPGAIAEQALWFNRQLGDVQMRWVSAHIELIAFDMIAMHYLPQSVRSQPVVAPTRGPALPVKVVVVGSFYILCAVGANTVHKAYKNMLWDYQIGMKNWVNAVTLRNAVGGRDGLLP